MIGVVLDSQNNPIETDDLLHPGEVIADEIKARGLKKKFVAEKLGLKPSNLSELLIGKRHVSAQLAIKLEIFLGISADYWMRVQNAYNLSIAKK